MPHHKKAMRITAEARAIEMKPRETATHLIDQDGEITAGIHRGKIECCKMDI